MCTVRARLIWCVRSVFVRRRYSVPTVWYSLASVSTYLSEAITSGRIDVCPFSHHQCPEVCIYGRWWHAAGCHRRSRVTGCHRVLVVVDVDNTTHSAFLVRHGAAVTVEWHEASAAAGRVGGEYGGWTAQQVITGAPRQPTVLRRRGGQGREVQLLLPLRWRVACPKRPRNRSASTRRLRDSCGVTRGTPGESLNFCCSVSPVNHTYYTATGLSLNVCKIYRSW